MVDLRVVIDTSCLISYLLTKGDIMRQVVLAWEEKEYQLLLTPHTYDELMEILSRPKISQPTGAAREWLCQRLLKMAVFLAGQQEVNGVCRDPKDDKFLACAVEGQAHYLVSSDKDLLVFGRYEGVCILNPGQFLVALQLARLPAVEIRQRYSREGLQTILAQLCLEAGTRDKVERALGD